MKILIGVVALLVLSITGFLAWAGFPWSLKGGSFKKDIVTLEPLDMVDAPEKPWVLKVLTWNLGFLYGEGSEGPGYEWRPKSFFEEKLKTLAQEIKAHNADIIFLQEIDFDSHRSGNLNQAQTLASLSGYPYVAEAVSWEANYIPFPYWPLSRNFGSMKSGGAILSRYPILTHEVVLLPKPTSNPWWYNVFYLHRYFQKVSVDVGGKKMSFINLHLEAFDTKDRTNQVTTLLQIIEHEHIDLVAGDFNMVPSSATKKSKFAGNDNYENDPSFEVMMRSELLEVIPEEIYSQDETRYFTFPSWKPDRRLDYIFYKKELKMMKAEVLPSALSDHLPLEASFQISSPKFNPYSQ